MPSCERCWKDSGGDTDTYMLLMESRHCTPEQQAGENAGWCPKCLKRTVHQHANICMNGSCDYVKEEKNRGGKMSEENCSNCINKTEFGDRMKCQYCPEFINWQPIQPEPAKEQEVKALHFTVTDYIDQLAACQKELAQIKLEYENCKKGRMAQIDFSLQKEKELAEAKAEIAQRTTLMLDLYKEIERLKFTNGQRRDEVETLKNALDEMDGVAKEKDKEIERLKEVVADLFKPEKDEF